MIDSGEPGGEEQVIKEHAGAVLRRAERGSISSALLPCDSEEEARVLYDKFWESVSPEDAKRLASIDIHKSSSVGPLSEFYASGYKTAILEPRGYTKDGKWNVWISSDDTDSPLEQKGLDWLQVQGFLPKDKERHELQIVEREVINAPSSYVSVYHESKTNRLNQIEREGLVPGREPNIMDNYQMKRKNAAINQVRPANLIELGISRENLYAYPFLEYGHGLSGAPERFTDANKGRDKRQLERDFPGEVLEIKVDPEHAYVADMELINQIAYAIERSNKPLQEVARVYGKEYWSTLMSLKDFLTWFKKPEGVDDYSLRPFTRKEGAPDSLPDSMMIPEVLIPKPVPPDNIRVLN